MKAVIYTLLVLSFSVTQIFSIGQEWVARYNGTANTTDWAQALAIDATGNTYVTGYSTGSGTSKDYRTIKYNLAGQVLWSASFNGPVNGGDYSYAIVVDNSGNVYVTGRVDFGAPTQSDILTIKYDSQGIQQWTARYNNTNNLDEARAIQVDNSGNVYVTGKTTGTNVDFVTIKYNPNGTEAWVSTYNGPGNSEDVAVSLAIDGSGNVYVAGASIGSGTGSDFTVIKYNSDGTQSWVKRYNGAGNGGDAAISVKVDATGEVYAAGFADMGAEKHNYYIVKYTSTGAVRWERQYNGVGGLSDIATAMVLDNNANVYVTGSSAQVIGTIVDSNYATVKYNRDGVQQWAAIYSGPNNTIDISRGIFVDITGNVYISGSSSGWINGDDYVTIKYTPAGATSWIMSYNGPANSNDYCTSIVADNNGNAYVSGRSFGIGTDYDYATIKYSDMVGINISSNEIPNRFNLYQNYPNPFNPSTKIKFDLPNSSQVVLKVYNTMCEEVFGKEFGNLQPATYEYSFAANTLTSGVYFYKLIAGEFISTKKMILVK